jgi:hypothetical protein
MIFTKEGLLALNISILTELTKHIFSLAQNPQRH